MIPTYYPRERQGSITPDIFVAKITDMRVEDVREDPSVATSDHHRAGFTTPNAGEG